jgi:hypothetical protein
LVTESAHEATAAGHEATAADIAQLLAEVDAGAWPLGKTRDDVLEAKTISMHTFIRESRVCELLDGADPEVPPHAKKPREEFFKSLVKQRLELVKERINEAPAGDGFSLRRVAEGVDLSHPTIDHLLKGKHSPRLDYAYALERHLKLPRGILSTPEGDALAAYLRKVITEALPALSIMADIEEIGGGKVSLRHTGDEAPALRDLVPVFKFLAARERAKRAQREQPEQS